MLHVGDSGFKGKKCGLLFSNTTHIGLGISLSFVKNGSPCGHCMKSRDFHAKILIGRIIKQFLKNHMKKALLKLSNSQEFGKTNDDILRKLL